MNIGSNKIIILLCLIAIIMAGVFCSAYFQMSNSDCPGSAHSDTWCSNVFIHGSIISTATFSSLFVLLLSLVFFLFLNLIRKSRNICSVGKIQRPLYHRQTFHILDPLQFAFSNGILHPKKPNTF